MKSYFREGYEFYKRIEYYRVEKRKKESRNGRMDNSRTVF